MFSFLSMLTIHLPYVVILVKKKKFHAKIFVTLHETKIFNNKIFANYGSNIIIL